MNATTDAVAAISRLAAGQWGLLTTAQAEREGVTRLQLSRLAAADILERVDRGVYATTSSSTDHRALRAAWLALDPTRTAEERLVDPIATGVASHTSAAGLHRLGDLLDDEPEITLPHRKQTRRGMRLHRLPLTDHDVTLVDGLPTTTAERTVADLLRDGHDTDHVAQIVGQGVRRGVLDLDDLADRLEQVAQRSGRTSGHELVEHLLDLAGLSPAALARELADTTAGRELVAAGRASALSQMVASFLPDLDTGSILDIIDPRVPASLFDPQLQFATAGTSTAAFRDALAMPKAPAVRDVRRPLEPDAGRRLVGRAADAPSAADPRNSE